MTKVDMSAEAVTTRLKRVSQLRRLGLSLQKAQIKREGEKTKGDKRRKNPSSKSDKRKSE